MKVQNGRPPFFPNIKSTKQEVAKEPSSILATGIGIDIRSKGLSENVVKENNPNDPLVSKKILDALSLDLVSFSQKERDTLAAIMGDRAKKVTAGNSSANL